ncbi:MAG: DUF309 domain-containing protein [Bacillus sp. (in: firmicutes)]
MSYPMPYIAYLVQFHGTRDYFECHEILEEYWKEVDPGNKDSHWVAFILIAVSAYHHRRHNFKGAEKTIKNALRILGITPKSTIVSLGIDYEALLDQLHHSLRTIQLKIPYQAKALPIIHETLLLLCKHECEHQGAEWCAEDYEMSDALIHRHTMRDRSDVIQERKRQKALRQRKSSHIPPG